MKRFAYASLVALLATAAACSDDKPASSPDMRVDPFMPQPECEPGTLLIKPLHGDRQLLISSLKIADTTEGFDLDQNGTIDNKLAPLGGVANNQIKTTFQFDHSLIVPIEMFGYTGSDSSCTKFAFYIGRYNEDRDHDGAQTSWSPGKADCDDTDGTINPGAAENTTDRVDNDCDGYADNMSKGVAPSDTQDLDGDGYTLAQGDCDDRNDTDHLALAKTRNPGAKDACGDGIDQNCDGIADNDPTCDPFKDNDVGVHVQALSFAPPAGTPDGGVLEVPDAGLADTTMLKPYIVFPDGNVMGGTLNAGPDLFSLSIPVAGSDLTLNLSGAHVKMDLMEMNGGTYVQTGLLGGVLEAVTLEQIRGLNAGGFLKPDQSLLDAVFVGPVATIIGLDSDDQGHYLPDIDVDGDGIETFWQTNVSASGDAIVDTCKDGDGTVVMNNFDGNGTPCALAKDPKTGKYRFVDGISVALKFSAVPAKLTDVVQQ